jgi:hypothetical protein
MRRAFLPEALCMFALLLVSVPLCLAMLIAPAIVARGTACSVSFDDE